LCIGVKRLNPQKGIPTALMQHATKHRHADHPKARHRRISNGTRFHRDKEQVFMAYEHNIEKDRCKGCGLCISVCPKNVLEISPDVNAKGYYPAFQARPDDCIHCTMCCIMCPDVAITIKETEEPNA